MDATIGIKTKFNIGDIVSFRNSTAFNPGHKVVTIGVITAIHIYGDAIGTVRYDVNGHCQTHMDESYFTLVRAASH
jgi:hypothetical protein